MRDDIVDVSLVVGVHHEDSQVDMCSRVILRVQLLNIDLTCLYYLQGYGVHHTDGFTDDHIYSVW